MELNKEEYVALCKVVDYLHDDELKHYEEWKEDNENSEHHIWNSVKTLSLKLKEHQMIDKHIPCRETMQNELEIETMCTIQHDGWTCSSCFFAISKELNNSDWQNILLLRGDYTEDELDNLPKDREDSLIKIYDILTNNKERKQNETTN